MANGPTVAQLAANLHVSTSELVARSGLSAAGLQARLNGATESSQAASVLASATLSPYDAAGGGSACYGYGHRGSWLDSTGATIGAARHDIYCPPIVAASTCEVEIRFPGQVVSSGRASGTNNCEAWTQEKINNYGTGVMHGEWGAISTANWIAHTGCITAGQVVYCTFNTAFTIPGAGSPWDDFAWAPSN